MLRRFLALSRRERRLVSGVWLLGVLCRLSLWALDYDGVRTLLARVAARLSVRGCTERQLVWAVQAALARVPGAKCLARALVLEALLRVNGREPQICLGVALVGGLRAHAWVELDGFAIMGAPQSGEYEKLTPVGAGRS